MTEKAIHERGSQTAGFTCFSRACAAQLPDERFRGPDHLAIEVLPIAARLIATIGPLRSLFRRLVFPAGIFEYVLTRTKLLDRVFVDSLEQGVSQIVLLGAGFDTRAWRFREISQDATIFELDIHTTQEAKIEVFRRKGLTQPENLVFAPIDFDRQSLADALHDAGFTDGQRNLFLWEGVTMYLTAEAVDDTLRFIRDHSAAGSQVVFDYVYAPVLRREHRYYGEESIYKTVSRAGEGWTFGLEEGEIGKFLSARGFELLSHHTPAELEEEYLVAEDGTRFGRVNGTHCIVLAATR